MFSITATDSKNKVVWLNTGVENGQRRPIRWVGDRDHATFFHSRAEADAAWERAKAYVSQEDFRAYFLVTHFGIQATECHLKQHQASGWHTDNLESIAIGI